MVRPRGKLENDAEVVAVRVSVFLNRQCLKSGTLSEEFIILRGFSGGKLVNLQSKYDFCLVRMFTEFPIG